MCRAIEEMLKDTEFKTKVDDILLSMKKLGWTKEQALEFYEIPVAEYPRYLAVLQ